MAATSNPLQELRAAVAVMRERFGRNGNEDDLVRGLDSVIFLLNKTISRAFASLRNSYRVCRQDDKTSTVVHYTGIETVINMFRDCIGEKRGSYLRLYDTFHFNDPDEGRYLEQFANHGELKNLASTMSPCAYVSSFVVPDGDLVDDVGDKLVFWRTYGLEGRGCSLKTKIPTDGLFRVKYGRKAASDAVADLAGVLATTRAKTMGALRPIMDIGDGSPKKRYVLSRLEDVTNSALRKEVEAVFYLHKSEAYEYENEVRIVRTVPSIKAKNGSIVFEYKSGESKVRHYHEDDALSVEKLLLTGSVITLGPCVAFRENIAYFLEYLKEKSGLIGPEVRRSRVSYRRN